MSRKKLPTQKAPKVVTPEVLDAEHKDQKASKKPQKHSQAAKTVTIEVEDADRDLEDAEVSSDVGDEVEPELTGEDEARDVAIPDPKDIDREIQTVSRAISATDPLRRYLDELRKHPLLAPDEELKLALELQKTGSVEAARRPVQANLRLVVKIAFEY